MGGRGSTEEKEVVQYLMIGLDGAGSNVIVIAQAWNLADDPECKIVDL